jgi:hypothetical protein
VEAGHAAVNPHADRSNLEYAPDLSRKPGFQVLLTLRSPNAGRLCSSHPWQIAGKVDGVPAIYRTPRGKLATIGFSRVREMRLI